ncbi:hypothetical protein C0Q99_14500 [Streptomyces albidoflavus]|nr:hypothetical protein C0Q99_14500 [Streptomyces albidoflavus]
MIMVVAVPAAATGQRRSGVSPFQGPDVRAREEDLVQAGQMPASVHSRRRRQQVTPLQPLASVGASAH